MTHQPSEQDPGPGPQAREAAQLPRFHGTGDDAGVDAGRQPRAARRRWALVAVATIVIALLVVMVVLHVTGAGPRMHG